MSDPLPHPRPPARRRRLRILLGIAVFAVAVAVAGYFFGRGKIGELVAGKVGERLAEDGVFIAWQSADWLPGSGVRLHGLALYRDAAKQDRLALFGMVTASRTDRSQFRWDRATFQMTDAPLLLGTGEGETRMEHTDMLLHIEPGKADLEQCQGSLQGLRIEAKCAFVAAAHAGNAEAVAAAKQVTQREGLFRSVNLDWLKSVKEGLKFQPEKDEPVLTMELHSLPDDRGMEATMTFDGANFQWRGQRWDLMQAAVKIPIGKQNSNSPIEIDHVRIGYAGRKAEIAGAFDPGRRVIRIGKFDSGIDLLSLARALVPDAVGGLSAMSTSGNWQISGAGEIPVDRLEDAHWSGDMAFDGGLVYANGETNIALQKPAFSLRVEEQVVSISDFQAVVWEGNLNAKRIQIHLPSKERKLQFESQFILSGARPQLMIKSFSEARNEPDVIPLDWKGAWQISVAGEIPIGQPGNFRWNGDMALDGDLVYASSKTNITLQKPAFSVRMEEQVVSISNLTAGLWEGNLDAQRIQVHLPSKDKNLQFETQFTLSDARSQSMINSFGEARKEPRVVPFDWQGAWQVSGAGEIPMDQPGNVRWSGDMSLEGDLVYASGETNVALQKPTFSVRVEEQVVSISDLKAGLWEGNLNAPRIQFHLPSKEKKLQFETQFTLSGVRPQAMINSFSKARKEPGVYPLDWQGAWQISVAGEVPMDQPENFRWSGDMALNGSFVYASGQTNIALQKPMFSVRTEQQVVTISDFKAGLWEGSLKAPKTQIRLPSKDRKLRFETQLTLNGARSQSVRKSFSARQKQPRVIPLSWKSAWRINVVGEIPVDHPENFRGTGDAALGGDLVYARGETKIALRQPKFSVRVEKRVVSISDFKAGLWEGSFNAPRTLVYLPSAKKKGRFETQFAINRAQLQSFVNSFGGAQTAPGVVQFDWKGGGEFDPASLAGSGAMSIGGAEFGRMPILGPLHLVFDILAPGFRKNEPSTMSVNHRISGGTLFLDDLKLVSRQVRVEAGGEIDLEREYAQFTAKGRLRRLPGLVTVLLTFLLEFKGEGPMDDVRWRFKSIPGFHLIGKAARKSTRTEAEKGADRALKGLIELPGDVLPGK